MPRLLRANELVNEERWQPQPLPPSEDEVADAPEVVEEVDLEALAEETRRQAEQEAEAIIDAARREADDIRERAQAEGLAAGKAEATAVMAVDLETLLSLATEINAEREAFFDRVEAELVRLSVSIAEKIIVQQLAVKPETVVDITRTMMKRVRERDVLRLRVNPDDLPLLREARPQLLAEIDGVRELQLFDDRRVTAGGVLVEATGGTLDARLPAQMEVIRKALDDELEALHESA